MAHRSAGQSALTRHLRVLDAFDPLRPFLTLSEISHAAGLSPSTAHRLVGELTREGLLERLPDRTYRLGVRLWEYAARTPGAVGLREVARPWLEAVQRRVGQHTQLGILQGSDVLFIERVSYPDAVVNATLIGGRIPAHASSAGLALLAHAPRTTLAGVANGPLRRYTAETITTAARLHDELDRVRRWGFASTDGHIHIESRGIAVPVRGSAGEVIAALGVVVPNDQASPRPIADLLTGAAAGVSRDLARASGHGAHASAEQLGISERSLAFIAELERDGARERETERV